MSPSARGWLVTGTDTGAGKTVAACVLLHALRARGLRASGMKPVASGCDETGDGLRNDDALALQAASDPRPPYADVNPFALPEPTAPQIAARLAGVEIALAPIAAAFERIARTADRVVVEGVGGWLAPPGEGIEHADLAYALRLPVVLVVGLRLGCLNHARLAARAIAGDGCTLAGWIGTGVDSGFAHGDAYVDLLRNALPAPCWGVLPHAPKPDGAVLAEQLRLPADL